MHKKLLLILDYRAFEYFILILILSYISTLKAFKTQRKSTLNLLRENNEYSKNVILQI